MTMVTNSDSASLWGGPAELSAWETVMWRAECAVNDLQASNMRRVGRTLYLADAKVKRLYVVGPRPRIAATATMLSYDGTCCIGINFDPHVITEPSVFSRCLQNGFDEVVALADRPNRRRSDVVR